MKRSFKRAATAVLGLAILFGAAGAGRNIYKQAAIDNIDPVGRVMTQGEIDMAQSVFGDTVNLNGVRIHKAPQLGDLAATTGTHIYMEQPALHGADLSQESSGKQAVLGHEITHIWQAQNASLLRRVWNAVAMMPARILYLVTGNSGFYNYSHDLHKGFDRLNSEQQAVMVGDYIEAQAVVKSDLQGPVREGAEKRIETLTPILRQALPVPGAR